MEPIQVVKDFYAGFAQKDLAAVGKRLHPDLFFQGPFDIFHSSAPYLEAIGRLHQIVQRVDIKKIFADGNDVCALWELEAPAPIGTCFVAEWLKVKGDKIASIRAVFDARPFAAMFAGGGSK